MNPTPLAHALARVAAATLALLLIPLLAMQFSHEVSWGWGDFAAAAILLWTAGSAYSLAARRARTPRRRGLVAVGILAVLALVWAELAVGLFS